VGTSASLQRPRTVLLCDQDLEDEVRRVVAMANLLPPGQEGCLKLKPYLHFKQCWHVINQLKKNGFKAKAHGELDSFGYTIFLPDSNGSLGISFIQRYRQVKTVPKGAYERRMRVLLEPGILEKLAIDKQEEARRIAIEKKKPPTDPRNAENNMRVKQLLSSLQIRPLPFADMAEPSRVPRRFRQAKAGGRKESKSKREARQKAESED
jgi:hypothetical protein